MRTRFVLLATLALGLINSVYAQVDGTAEATKAMAKFNAPAGFRVDLWAAEPLLGNPVAFCIDERGRLFVAETYRFNRGTEEYRHRPFFLEGDLKNTTLDDRLAMYKQFERKFPGGMAYFSKYSDKIRLLEDRAGKGKADFSTVFADGFNDPLDGLAAGVLAKDGDVYFTCIPKLWKLRDTKGVGKADQKIALHHGFGPMTAFLGHDLHGLIFGPDGRLYFSVGDRGYHVKTHEGKVLSGPRTGAVFRCDPDGKNLEVVHTGLRNPQELAFDQFGNLFAADNNCDKGDDSRLVYIIEGGNSGWNMAYQTIGFPPAPPNTAVAPTGLGEWKDYPTGPWHAEKLWHPHHSGQAAYIVPPVGKLGAGPSGFTFASGLGWPNRYQNAFFMCNFTGNGGIDSFRVRPKGACFELFDYHSFLSPVSATDVDFGYDGKMYLSDWVQFTWDGGGVGKGRIYAVYDPKTVNDPATRDMAKLMKDGFKKRDYQALLKLLGHPDQRVRLRAQNEVAEAWPRTGGLYKIAWGESEHGKDIIPRIHAIWAIGQMARKHPGAISALVDYPKLLEDKDAEIRAQAVKVLGEVGWHENTWPGLVMESKIVSMIDDEHPRVRYFAMQTAGKMKISPGHGNFQFNRLSRIFAQIFINKDRDPHLRHAAVQALINIGDIDAVFKEGRRAEGQLRWAAKDAEAERAVRLAAVLVLRGVNDKRVAHFLNDADELVVIEAARAINDLPIDAGTDGLARLSERYVSRKDQPADALWRRIVNANFRLGRTDNARAILDVVKSTHVREAIRLEALTCLGEWGNPTPRDRVTGFWRPLEKRDGQTVARLVEEQLPALLSNTAGKTQIELTKLVDRLKIKADEAFFIDWVGDNRRSAEARIASLHLLANRKAKDLTQAIQIAVASDQPALRAVARELLCDLKSPDAYDTLKSAIDGGTTLEKQRAIRALARLKDDRATKLLSPYFERMGTDLTPPELQLDVLEAARTRNSALWSRLSNELAGKPDYAERMRIYRVTLRGGDAERGRHVFVSHPVAQCIRCHKVDGHGGESGPNLNIIAPKANGNREHFLESLLFPSKKLTHGFGVIAIELTSGKIVSGTVRSEDKTKIVLVPSDGKPIEVLLADIESRSNGISPMPEMGPVLTMDEMRDVIEFLATLKSPPENPR